MWDYIVFFGLLLVSFICYVLFELRPKEKIILDNERHKTESPIERILYDALKTRGVYTKTQYPIGKYRIDIAIPSQKIAIECDGKHHLEPKQKLHDKRRDIYLKKNGWVTLRFSGRRIYRELPIVVQRIEKEKSSLK